MIMAAYHLPPFADYETEAQKGEAIFPKAPQKVNKKPRLESGSAKP